MNINLFISVTGRELIENKYFYQHIWALFLVQVSYIKNLQ